MNLTQNLARVVSVIVVIVVNAQVYARNGVRKGVSVCVFALVCARVCARARVSVCVRQREAQLQSARACACKLLECLRDCVCASKTQRERERQKIKRNQTGGEQRGKRAVALSLFLCRD